MSRAARLTTVLVLNVALIAGLAIVGLTAHSVAVIAEGGDYLADAAAIAATLLAISLSRRAPTPRRPHGYPRATQLAALLSAGSLLAVSVIVVATALHRLLTGTPEVHGLPVLVVSGSAAAVMLIGALILRGAIDDDGPDGRDPDDLHMRAVLLDTAADAVAAGGVTVAGAIILVKRTWYWLDPAVAVVIAVVIAFHSARLLREIGVALRARKGRS